MIGSFPYAIQLVVRNPRRTLAYVFGLTLAVGLFSAILFFVDVSSGRMTQAAVAPLAVDLQIRSAISAQDLGPVAATGRGEPLVRAVAQVRTLRFAGATGPAGAAAPGGMIFVLDPGFFRAYPSLRIAAGRFDSQGVMLSQSMVRTLGVHLGDRIELSFDQMTRPLAVPVTGVVDPSRASYLFLSTDPAHAGEVALVANDIFLTPALWRQHLATPLAHPDPGVRAGVGPQLADARLFLALHHAALPGDPIRAKQVVHQLQSRLAKGFPGQLAFTNNVADALNAAGSDTLWAKLLLLFLGMPGVALAAYLAKYASDLLIAPQRREIALLRTRGAGPRQILLISASASLMIAMLSTLLGLVLGVVATLALVGPAVFLATPVAALARSAGLTVLAGVLLTAAATYLPLRQSLRRAIVQERPLAQRRLPRPFWARAYLDLVCLVLAALIFWVTAQGGGFRPVESAEGASLSLGFFVFLGPLLVWLGATLLLSRIMSGGIGIAGGLIRRFLRTLLGELGEVAGRTIVRRATQIGGAVVIVALALSFGTSLAIFTRTYHAQKAADARYALGADLQVIPAASAPRDPSFVTALARVPGVAGVTPILQTTAIVGSNRQAIYGVEPSSLAQVGDFPAGSFVGASRGSTLRALQTTPDGVLVSAALAATYDVKVGDPVLFQVIDARTKQPVPVRTRAVGLVRHFPASVHDNFLVVNLPLLIGTTHQSAVTTFLATTRDPPGVVAARVRQQLGQQSPLDVRDVDTAVLAIGTTLTSLNVDRLSWLEEIYTLVIASVGLGIFLLAILAERTREFATLLALGATTSQLRRLVWADALAVGLLALVIGVPLGLGLGRLFILLLTVLFTVPPAGIVVPGQELVLLVGLAILSMVASTLVVGARLQRLDVAQALREL